MVQYRYKAVRKADGQEILSGRIDDVLHAGEAAMKMAIMAGLLHTPKLSGGLSFDDVEIELRPLN